MRQHLVTRGSAFLALGATAVLAAGCGSSAKPAASAATPGSTVGTSVIRRAADVSGAAKGEKVRYTLTEKAPSVGSIVVSGTGTFDNAPRQGQISLKVDAPGAAGLGSAAAALSNLNVELAISHQTVYVHLPASLTGLLSSFTQGRSWLSLNLANLAATGKIPGLSALLNGAQGTTDPTAEFKYFQAASANGVTRSGTATVDGVTTTEYTGSLDLSKLAANLPASLRAAMQAKLAEAQKALGRIRIPFTVAIDSADLIRRVVLTLPTPSGDAGASATPGTLQIDFISYGAQPAPTLPSAGDTFNLDGLVAKYAARAASAANANGFFGG